MRERERERDRERETEREREREGERERERGVTEKDEEIGRRAERKICEESNETTN